MALFEQSYTLQSLKKCHFSMWMSKSGLSDNMTSCRKNFGFPFSVDGGPDWTRTSDPTLIKRVL